MLSTLDISVFFSRLASSGSRRGGVQNSEQHMFCLIWHSAVNAQMLVENISIDEGSVVFMDFLFKFPRPGFAPTCLAAKVRKSRNYMSVFVMQFYDSDAKPT